MKDFERKMEIVSRLRPIDDNFFEKLAEDKDVCQEMLRTILGKPNLKVLQVVRQNSVRNLQGRSVVLDALCEIDDGKFCNIEIQKSDNDNHIKRVRYNASCITANITDTGLHFENVPDVYVVYITRFDIFKSGKTIYHIGHIVLETGEIVDNGLNEIYVNTKVDDGSDIAELMKCFESTDVNNPRFPKLSERVNYFKHDEKGVAIMCDLIREYGEELAAEAEARGISEGVRKIVTQMLKAGKYAVEEISGLSGLSVDEINEMKSLMNI